MNLTIDLQPLYVEVGVYDFIADGNHLPPQTNLKSVATAIRCRQHLSLSRL